jgi:hypothetical protein
MKKRKTKGFKTIGKSVLEKGKGLLPSEFEFTAKLPSPFDVISLRAKWEKRENRKLTDEEFKTMLRAYLKEKTLYAHTRPRKKSLKIPKETQFV